jgi:hypothetical protein
MVATFSAIKDNDFDTLTSSPPLLAWVPLGFACPRLEDKLLLMQTP